MSKEDKIYTKINEIDFLIKESRFLYKESLVCYKKILENYKLLSRELDIYSALELSHLFSYMLWNGYYSVNKEHKYNNTKRLFLPSMYSFDVIKGRGVCLDYVELLHNYLTICDKKSSILSCEIPLGKESITCNYRPEIERNIKSSIYGEVLKKTRNYILTKLTKDTNNHAVNLIEENNKLFIYDPTNLYVLNLVDKNTATIINGKGNIKLNPRTMLGLPNSDPNHLFKKLSSINIEPAFTRKEIIFSFENTMEIINNNVGLLDDAYDNIHPELEFINKQTDEIGGASKILKRMDYNQW